MTRYGQENGFERKAKAGDRIKTGSGKRGKAMKVLIVGGGGREHAIAVSMKKSSRVEQLYCVPGNAGIARIAECESSIGVMEFDKIVPRFSFVLTKVIFVQVGVVFGLNNKPISRLEL